jgi:Uma2 family endonuclease
MNVQQTLRMEKPAFLAWVEGREGRYELAEGQVIMMTGGTRWHALVVGNVYDLLRRKLDRKRWTVMADFAVDIGPCTVRYPDLVVENHGEKGTDLISIAPVVVVEVLSPTTTKTDFGDKAVEYLRLPSVAAYIILAQDEVKGWVYNRPSTELPAPVPTAGRERSISIQALNVTLPLAEIYDGIEFDE